MFRRFFAFLLLAGVAVAAQGETVYVSDVLRVGVRAEPASEDAPLAVVTSGDELEVLARAGGFVKIRTGAGATGWVSNVYVTAEPPARLRVQQLQTDHTRLQQELEQIRNSSGDALGENQRLRAEMASLREEAGTLHEKVTRLHAEANRARDSSPWVYVVAAMVALFIAGIVLGALWYRQRITARLGGLHI